MSTARFPYDFTADPQTDYIEFKTVRRNYNGDNGGYSPEKSAGISNVILYMPQKITEGVTQNYRNTRLGPEGSSILTGSDLPGSKKGFNPFVGQPLNYNLGDIARRLAENASLNAISNSMSLLGTDSLDANAILSATSGVIYNPMMEVLYDGPNFRKFNYQFLLFAKSDRDAQEIFKIVRFFQFASVPSSTGADPDGGAIGSALVLSGTISAGAAAATTAVGGVSGAISSALAPGSSSGSGGVGGAISTLISGAGSLAAGVLGGATAALGGTFGASGRFIRQPPQFEITYKRGADNHPYILSPERCVLESLSIDYTPTGNYTVLNNFGSTGKATTVATVVTLGFTEIKIKYRESYDQQFS